jgi:endonuclease G
LVRNDTFEVPQADTWRARLYPAKSRLDAAIRSVGRLEVTGAAVPVAGTAWIIAPNIAVTNRHVVAEVVHKRGGEFAFRPSPIGQAMTATLGFKEEYAQVRPFEVGIRRVLYLADGDADAPDLAFVELEPPRGRLLPPPIPLYAGEPEPGQVVALIGYPLEDRRNSLLDEARIFGGVHEVKRLAPGQVTDRLNRRVFTHDCTALGDHSGSVVLDVTTGAALGLHFAGDGLDAGFAVSAPELRRHLDLMLRGRSRGAAEAMRPILLRPAEVTRPEPEEVVPLSAMRGRTGYDENFLRHKVPLPKLSAGLAGLASVVDSAATGTSRFLLQYEHFSIAMHSERRLAIFTAVNIDGGAAKKIKRKGDKWGFDPRIAKSLQVGNELYAGNDLDRGHLVRRLDPAWGPGEEAKRAEVDTFFFTNSTPQHAGFNQRLWLELEDYLLGNASTLGFRACVFTGPVFSERDSEYRGVLLPKAYWKVATMVDTETEELTATGYMVSQADLITDIEFVFGQVRTYQVPLSRIEELTGLRFGTLKSADPLEGVEALPGVSPIRELRSLSDISL